MHNPRGKEATNRQRRRAMHTGSKGWKLQRARVLARDEYTCQHCGQFGDQVDHIHGDAHEHVTDDRLQVLCLKCHSRKTMGVLNGKR
jgi:5-methylcytosine-specific restriction endonuclease McrA